MSVAAMAAAGLCSYELGFGDYAHFSTEERLLHFSVTFAGEFEINLVK